MNVTVIDHDPEGGIRRYHALACACRGAVETCPPALAQFAKLGLVMAATS